MEKANEIVCEICNGQCKTGVIFLKTRHVVCVECIYKRLGSDNYYGRDWSFSILHDIAQQLIDEKDESIENNNSCV